MLGKAKLADAFAAGSHGSTFGGTPIATAAAIATIETILDEKLQDRAAEIGSDAIQSLSQKLTDNPLVKTVRGKGLLIGIVCTQPVAEIITEIHKQGVLVIPAGTHVIRLAPSLNISQEDLNQGIEIICSVLAKQASATVQ
jgi:acetylornithine aminotransferase